MKSARITHGLVLLFGGLLLSGLSSGLLAATSSLDVLPGERAGDNADVELGTIKPIGTPANPETIRPVPRGNPLWSVPLSVLTATQKRPIFSASRRPPPLAVIAPPAAEAKAPAPRPVEPERMSLALIGAVVGDGDAIAVFVDRTSQKMIRLRPGEVYDGWILNSVLRSEVTLKKDDRTETIGLRAIEPALLAKPR